MVRGSEVALIQMPFAVSAWPSLGLSLIKSALRVKKIPASVNYFNLRFADVIGVPLYEAIALGAPNNTDLLGEWLFCEDLWGPDAERDAKYLSLAFPENHERGVKRTILQHQSISRSEALAVRSCVRSYLDNCVSMLDWSSLKLVGFTSVFQQHVPSLALAKRLKLRYPHLCIVMGGANCEGGMGSATLDNFSFIDAVCSGEGDVAFPSFVEAKLKDKIIPIAGILTRAMPNMPPVLGSVQTNTAPIHDMDALPFPDYDDFFECSAKPGDSLPQRLIFETSRGCWWGQKHHCTFCGLNGMGMAFRSKSAHRAIAELKYLVERYGKYTNHFSAADNIIPMNYFESFLPELETLDLKLDLFYETKANLTEVQIAQYKRAGLGEIQPGIESLNTDVLRLMNKGITSLQNIQLLKWCSQYGIHPYWNYLFGFPGEKRDWYVGQAEIISQLTHLCPPVGCAPVRFDRFSPFHTEAAAFGISQLKAYPAYDLVYSGLSTGEVQRLAYYFTGSFDGQDQIESYTRPIVKAVVDWKEKHAGRALFHYDDDACTVIFDCRTDSSPKVLLLEGSQKQLFKSCASIKYLRVARLELEGSYSVEQSDRSLEALMNAGLLLLEDGRLLSVSVPLGYGYAIPEKIKSRFAEELILDEKNGMLCVPNGRYTYL